MMTLTMVTMKASAYMRPSLRNYTNHAHIASEHFSDPNDSGFLTTEEGAFKSRTLFLCANFVEYSTSAPSLPFKTEDQ